MRGVRDLCGSLPEESDLPVKVPLFCSLPSLAERTKTEMFFKTYSAESEDMFGVPLRGIRATKKFRARTKYKDRR